MSSPIELDSETWLRQQRTVIYDVFDRATKELQELGIRVLTGSAPPKFEELDSVIRVTLFPLRYTTSSDGESLLLVLLATSKGGAPHYAAALDMSGVRTCEAFQKLGREYPEVWEKGYLKTGLWVGDGEEWELLNSISQINAARTSKRGVSGTFLHSATARTIEDGLMAIGLLYRSVLDVLCGAGRMGRLSVQLSNCLGNRRATFQRILRP